jgi:DNA-binding NarL/FixJ family response regulator
MSTYQIILADDHALLRQGLKKIIDERPGLSVIGDVGDGLSLLGLVKKTAPRMVIADISMPNLRGIEAIGELKKLRPAVKVLILTMHKEVEFVDQAVSAGADGYLLKENADSELFAAIDTIRQGRFYLSPELSKMVTDVWAKASRKGRAAGDALTPRERQVLKMMAEGKTSKEIADLLFISARTVEHHRANIMGRLNLRNTAELVKYAILKGYV